MAEIPYLCGYIMIILCFEFGNSGITRTGNGCVYRKGEIGTGALVERGKGKKDWESLN